MKKLLSIILLSLLLYSCGPQGTLFENALCIQNITIIDPNSGPIENQTVIIKDGRIEKISPTSELKLAEENTIIDGTGKYLIPGLWDTHIHFAYIEDMAPRMFNLFLAYGITSVRDTGGRIGFVDYWRDQSLLDTLNAPRVMIAGPLLDGMPNVYDGSDPGHPPLSIGHYGLDDLDATVGKLDSIHVDLIKAYEMLTPEQFMHLMKLAKERNLPTTGHVPLSMDVISASNAGLGGMQHLRNLEMSVASNADELLAERRQLLEQGKDMKGGALRSSIHDKQRIPAIKNYDEQKAMEVIEVLRKNQTYQTPTISLITGFAYRHWASPEYQKTFDYIPEAIASNWKSTIDQITQGEMSEDGDTYAKWAKMMVKKLHDNNVPVLAGTDAPIGFATPGYSLHKELEELVASGLSPLDALKAATITPSEYFGLQNELGLIKEGYFADLVILDANPLEDIRNTKSINSVIRNGNYLDLAKIQSMLNK